MFDANEYKCAPYLMDAWIAPNGTFYAVPETSHSFFARNWLESKGSFASDPVTTLEQSGWLHLSGGGLYGETARDPERITSAQMDVLMLLHEAAGEDTIGYFAKEFMISYDRIMTGGTDW